MFHQRSNATQQTHIADILLKAKCVSHATWRKIYYYTSLYYEYLLSQQTQNVFITFVQCWINVEDVGPTLYKCYKNVCVCWDMILSAHAGDELDLTITILKTILSETKHLVKTCYIISLRATARSQSKNNTFTRGWSNIGRFIWFACLLVVIYFKY